MSTSRLSLIEESLFQDSETSCLNLNSRGLMYRFSRLILKMLPIVSICFSSRQLSGMRIQNIFRYVPSSKSVMLALLWGAMSEAQHMNTFNAFFSRFERYVQGMSRAVSFVGLIAFLSGFLREVRPEMIFARSNPSCSAPTVQRVCSLEFLVRYLITNSISSFAIILAPFFDFHSIFRLAQKRFFHGVLDAGNFECGECVCSSVFACVTEPCGHLYCYYCIKSKQLPFACGACGNTVKSFGRASNSISGLNLDVIE